MWPDVSTSAGRRTGTVSGGFAALWLAIDSLLTLASLLVTGQSSTEAAVEMYQISSADEIVASLLLICLYSFVSWRIWHHQGDIAAILVLIFVALSSVRQMSNIADGNIEPANALITILFLQLAVNGVRGTSAHRKWHLAEGKVKPRPRPP